MRQFRIIAAAFALAVIAALPSHAQTTRPAAPATTTGGGAAGSAKIAIIDSGAFTDEKAGIVRVVNAMKTVDSQFQPLRTEVQGLQQRYDALVADIQKTSSIADPKTIAQKQEQAEQLQTQIKRKSEDGQAALQKKMQDVLGPLQDDVFSSLQTFAQQRGISVIIDVNRVPVIVVTDSADITKEFITEYNRTHPATAAATSRP